jgi:hypothetical protein
VADQGLGYVERNSAEKDGEQGDPFEVFPETAEDATFFYAVAEDAEGEVAQNSEDEDNGEVDWSCVSM